MIEEGKGGKTNIVRNKGVVDGMESLRARVCSGGLALIEVLERGHGLTEGAELIAAHL